MEDIYISNFVDSMKKELETNNHKGSWVDYSNKSNCDDILNELDYHITKLKNACINKDISKIKEYCSDVSNISMFLFTSYDKKYTE